MDFLKKLSVLYIEDEDSSRELLSEILRDFVGEIDSAVDGQDGFDKFKKKTYDIVISDILMPRMDGLEFVRNVREGDFNADVPLILATAFTETKYLLDSIKLKCDGYILKPIDLDELLETMKKAYLPRLHSKNLEVQNRLLKTLSEFYGGKKIEIIQYLIENCDNEQIYHGSIENIADSLDISRQTIAKAFSELSEAGLIKKIKNKTYKLCEYK
ncbi:response regulator [Helicobacter saguini]|uniref:response regulator n=1 Tax=Helicobacter saguini TaxID=1548018 RepID=UPI000AD10374|nr:response regulator [Helicobacter saguini]